MKAFIFEPLWDALVTPSLIADLESAGIEYHVVQKVAPLKDCSELYEDTEERLLYINPDYVNWKLTNEDYQYIPNLKGIFGAATSFAWIETDYATAHDIPVSNIKGFSSEAVAEWAIMTLLNLARQLPRIIKDGYPLDFDKDFMKYRGMELHGKTAGIVGMGRIGSLIAQRCRGLGMNVIYWSKNTRASDYEYAELDTLMSTADVIFPIMAANDSSTGLITEELLRSMKNTAILVDETNHLFNQQVALDMVRAEELFGFGFEADPESFTKFEGNVWAAPQYGWATDASMQASVRMQIENMIAASKGEFPNRIN